MRVTVPADTLVPVISGELEVPVTTDADTPALEPSLPADLTTQVYCTSLDRPVMVVVMLSGPVATTRAAGVTAPATLPSGVHCTL